MYCSNLMEMCLHGTHQGRGCSVWVAGFRSALPCYEVRRTWTIILLRVWYFRDNPYHNTAILGGMWGARMDTGMRETLDTSFRQLINSVKTKWFLNLSNCGAWLTITWHMPPDCALEALAQGIGSDHACSVGLAPGKVGSSKNLAKSKRWKSTRWFTTPTSANDHHLRVLSQNPFLHKEKKVFFKYFKHNFESLSFCTRSVQLCGSSRTNGGESCLSRGVSAPWSPRLDPLLRGGIIARCTWKVHMKLFLSVSCMDALLTWSWKLE